MNSTCEQHMKYKDILEPLLLIFLNLTSHSLYSIVQSQVEWLSSWDSLPQENTQTEQIRTISTVNGTHKI